MPMLLLLGGGIATAILCFFLSYSNDSTTQVGRRPLAKALPLVDEPIIDRIEIPEPPGILRRWGIPAEATFDLIVGADGRPRKMTLVWCTHQAVARPAGKAIKQAVFSPAIGPEGEPLAVWVRVVVNMEDAVWDLISMGRA